MTVRKNNIQRMIEEQYADCRDRFTTIVCAGVPFKEILETVDKEEIDLVAIGSKGRSNLARTLFGSNTEKVLRHSPVPALSICGYAIYRLRYKICQLIDDALPVLVIAWERMIRTGYLHVPFREYGTSMP